jgi:hypothetical protein
MLHVNEIRVEAQALTHSVATPRNFTYNSTNMFISTRSPLDIMAITGVIVASGSHAASSFNNPHKRKVPTPRKGPVKKPVTEKAKKPLEVPEEDIYAVSYQRATFLLDSDQLTHTWIRVAARHCRFFATNERYARMPTQLATQKPNATLYPYL